MSATITSFPPPSLSYDCLKTNLDQRVVRDMDKKMWALAEPGAFIGPKDEYANGLSSVALKGVGTTTAKKLKRAGIESVRDFAYAAKESVVGAGTTAAQRAALGRLHDALRVCTGDVWIQ